MEVLQENNSKNGHFYIADADNREVAGMYYVYAADNHIIIDHTEVAEEYEGRGLGKQLLMALVKWVRTQQIKVTPLCPFARAMFERMPEIGDVLK